MKRKRFKKMGEEDEDREYIQLLRELGIEVTSTTLRVIDMKAFFQHEQSVKGNAFVKMDSHLCKDKYKEKFVLYIKEHYKI